MSECVHCNGLSGAPVEFRFITGWERKASPSSSRKGGSDVYVREPHPSHDWACGVCIRRLREGLSVEQGSLL